MVKNQSWTGLGGVLGPLGSQSQKRSRAPAFLEPSWGRLGDQLGRLGAADRGQSVVVLRAISDGKGDKFVEKFVIFAEKVAKMWCGCPSRMAQQN